MKKIPLLMLLSAIIFLSLHPTLSYAQDDSLPTKRIVGYFAEWNIYLENNYYEVSDIPWDMVTHINYAFAKIENGRIAIIDKWAAIQKPFGDDTWDTPIRGHFGQLIKYKEQYPHVKTLISVGGWTESKYFSDVALTEESRNTFADSCVEFIRTYRFDGVDIDWEYPVSGGMPENIRRPEDKQNFTLLLKCLREKLDAAGAEDGKHYLLTIAAPAGSFNIKNTEPEIYHQYLDFINIMTYDYSGSWENVANHLAPLYMNPNDPSYPERKEKFNVDWTVKEYLRLGVAAEKINVGVPYYAAGWQEVNGGINGLFGTSSKPLSSTQFHYINSLLKSPDLGFTRYWDEYAMVPYLWNPESATFYSYEDEISLKNKCDYVIENNLGGIMIWELSGDYPAEGGTTLTSVIYDSFTSFKDEIYGDLNGDGKVNSSDLAILKRYMLRAISDFPIPEGRKLADLNRDGNVNSTDYSILKRYILKAIDNIPVDD